MVLATNLDPRRLVPPDTCRLSQSIFNSFRQMGSAIEDVTEWEQRVEDSQDAFQKISEVIKVQII